MIIDQDGSISIIHSRKSNYYCTLVKKKTQHYTLNSRITILS